ncbi:MAG TPA: (4Fe-4S)-binding protein [Pyrinomonadaceae bacterium]|nr:(4Fe-4S)-binding protein [Pyrinomonadaceae bacterium]
MTEKRYTNDEITVVWKPETCIHSTLCWKGLVRVFNPKARPWVNINGAETEKIIEQINKCPSGALSYFYNSENEESAKIEAESIVEVMENGPLLVYGNLKIKDAAGNETTKHKVTAFCRCGASENKPFCDGSHKKIDFKG